MTDADTSRNLRWQRDVNGDEAKVATSSGGTLNVHNLLNCHRYNVLPWKNRPLHWGLERNAGMRPGGVASSECIRVEEMHGA